MTKWVSLRIIFCFQQCLYAQLLLCSQLYFKIRQPESFVLHLKSGSLHFGEPSFLSRKVHRYVTVIFYVHRGDFCDQEGFQQNAYWDSISTTACHLIVILEYMMFNTVGTG